MIKRLILRLLNVESNISYGEYIQQLEVNIALLEEIKELKEEREILYKVIEQLDTINYN